MFGVHMGLVLNLEFYYNAAVITNANDNNYNTFQKQAKYTPSKSISNDKEQ